MKKKNLLLLIGCTLNAAILIFGTFLWIRTTYVNEDEFILIRVTSFLKKIVFKMDEKPDKNRFLFVSVSYDKQLVEHWDEELGFPIGNQAITDREKLAKFLNVLNKKPENHKYAVVDIFFKDVSPTDSLLQTEFDKLNNYIVSYHKKEDESPDVPVFKVNKGLSDYEIASDASGFAYDGFAKYKMIQGDTLKTLPLRMYEKLHNKRFEQGSWLSKIGSDYFFNVFILDFRIRAFDLSGSENPYDKVFLGELLFLPDEAIHELTKDRIIVIGDFDDRDIHETIYGETPGPLILLNAFLALEGHDNKVNAFFILFLFLGFFLASYRCFTHKDFLQDKLFNRLLKNRKAKGLLSGVFGYLMYFFVLSTISYFIFEVHLTIVVLAIYMRFVEWVVRNVENRMRAKPIAVILE